MKRSNKFKLSIVSLMLVLVLALAACGSNDDEKDSESAKGDIDYPEKTIEILLGHGAGGGTDLFARAVAKELEDELDVSVNVVNQEGGAGVVAIENAFNKPSDGHTLVAISAFPITTAAGTNQHGLDDFKPIARFQSDIYGLWVNEDSFDTIEEFIEYAEKNPGDLKVGGTGSLGLDEITAHLFGKEADIDINFVPMEGAGEMQAGVVGDHLDAMVEEFGPADSLYQDGSIKPLVVFNEERLDDFPDLPTTEELGWDLTGGNERGFIIKRDTDPEIVEVLEKAMKNIYESEDYKEYEENNFLHLREGWLDSEDYEKRLEESIEEFSEVIEELE